MVFEMIVVLCWVGVSDWISLKFRVFLFLRICKFCGKLRMVFLIFVGFVVKNVGVEEMIFLFLMMKFSDRWCFLMFSF